MMPAHVYATSLGPRQITFPRRHIVLVILDDRLEIGRAECSSSKDFIYTSRLRRWTRMLMTNRKNLAVIKTDGSTPSTEMYEMNQTI